MEAPKDGLAPAVAGPVSALPIAMPHLSLSSEAIVLLLVPC